MSKFRIGSYVIAVGGYDTQANEPVKFIHGEKYLVLSHKDDTGCIRVRSPGGAEGDRFEHWFAPAPPGSKEQKAIAKAEADLAKRKERAALKEKAAAEKKAKAARAKLMSGLTAGGKRIIEALRAKPEAFGCQREMAIALAAAITGDKADDIRKALA